MSLFLLALASFALIAVFALVAVRHFVATPCPECRQEMQGVAERLVCENPLVIEVAYRCAGCGRRTVRDAVAHTGD